MSIFLDIGKKLNARPKVDINKGGNFNCYPEKDENITQLWVLTNELYIQYEDLILHKNNNEICQKIENLLNEHRLEKKMLALELNIYLSYIYVCLTNKLFQHKFINNEKTIKLINSVDRNNIIDLDLKRKLAIIHATFDHQNNYLVYIDESLSLPWNDYILPTLGRQMFSRNRLINDISLPKYSDTDITSRSIIIEEVSLQSRKLELYRVGLAIYENDLKTLNETLYGENINRPRIEKFLSETFPVAVSINGTACSYKTTLINKCHTKVINEVDPHSRIMKIGKMGRFSGKDNNQVLAMNYQYMTSSLTQVYYSSIFDRCKFNNTIWRIILACLDTSNNLLEVALEKFMDFSPYLIQQMKLEPIIILIDTDVIANRKRMQERAHGSDMIRSLIENYVPAQNIVYGMMAYLCEWPIFPANLSLHASIIDHVLTKTKTNILNHGGKLPLPCTIPRHKLQITGNSDNDESFMHAKNLNIFK